MMKKWIPHNYQEKAVNDIIDNKNRQIWFLPGDGKTSCVLDAIVKLIDSQEIKKILIVAPIVAIYDTWPKEIEKWKQFSHLTYAILHGKKRFESIKKEVDIYLINFEGLKWFLDAKKDDKKTTYNLNLIKKLNIDMLVIDELSKCKNISTLQSRCLFQISKQVNRRVGLTGTPASNSLIDVFGQALAIDNGETFGKSIWNFYNLYFYQEYRHREKSYGYKILPGAANSIYKALSKTVTQREFHSDSDRIFSEHKLYFKLPEKIRILYDEIVENFVASYDDCEVTASNAAVKTIKLRQITSGFFYHENEIISKDNKVKFIENGAFDKQIKLDSVRDVKVLHTLRREILRNLINELNGHPLLIFYQFSQEVDDILWACGDYAPVLTTKSLVNDSGIVDRWNNGELPCLIAHPKSLSYSANLQMSGGHLCFYSPEISLEMYKQSIARIHRQGNPNPETRCYYILAENTFDEYVLRRIDEKDECQNNLMINVKQYVDDIRNK